MKSSTQQSSSHSQPLVAKNITINTVNTKKLKTVSYFLFIDELSHPRSDTYSQFLIYQFHQNLVPLSLSEVPIRCLA